MIVLELTFPNRGSWNNKWSGDGEIHCRLIPNRKVPNNVIDNDYYYTWDDGWTACVSVRKVNSNESRKINKNNKGFCGYDWMVNSIIDYGEILTQKQILNRNAH